MVLAPRDKTFRKEEDSLRVIEIHTNDRIWMNDHQTVSVTTGVITHFQV
jgi:hypothetical protein